MSKLYFDCPIEATYTQKTFGVNLLYKEGDDDVVPYRETLQQVTLIAHDLASEDEKDYIHYIVHPDSLHIFEPQELDVVECERDVSGTRGHHLEMITLYDSMLIENRKINDTRYQWKVMQIIQRDNKPFFMPKRER